MVQWNNRNRWGRLKGLPALPCLYWLLPRSPPNELQQVKTRRGPAPIPNSNSVTEESEYSAQNPLPSVKLFNYDCERSCQFSGPADPRVCHTFLKWGLVYWRPEIQSQLNRTPSRAVRHRWWTGMIIIVPAIFEATRTDFRSQYFGEILNVSPLPPRSQTP